MVAPDVQIEDGKGTILISSEEGETDGKEEAGTTQCITCSNSSSPQQRVVWLRLLINNLKTHSVQKGGGNNK